MPYVPINTAAYTATFAGAISGMAVSGWITDPDSADYNDVTVIAGAFAQAFDTVWNDVAQLNELELACMTSVVQQDFSGRGPGPFESTLFKDPANWNIAARACVALILECDIFFAVEGIVPGPGGSPTPASIAAAYETNWLVTDWYIDGVVGVDTNDGTSVGTPIKTGEELLRRLGPYAIWPQSVTVHVLENGMIDALVLRGLMQVAGDHLDVIGSAIQIVDGGTIASYTARNHATPEADLITATGITDWSTYQWRRVRVTAGANLDAIAWIALGNPSGLGLNVARISKPFATGLTSAISVNNTTVVLAVGNPIVVESVPEIPCLVAHIDGPLLSAATPAYVRRQFSVRDIQVQTLKIQGFISDASTYLVVQKCRLNNVGIYVGNSNAASIGTIGGCLIFNREQGGTIRMPDCCLLNCLIGDSGSGFVVSPHAQVLASSLLMQGIRLSISTTVIAQIADIQIFNCASTTTAALDVSQGRVSGCSGNGNAGYGYGIVNKTLLTLAGTQNLQGAVSNARLSTTPAINLTIPQLLQPSDYAQKGTTPPMVAGTTTVTVPWYDNTVQKITATHATFGGTPGTLSVQPISNTQFNIVSAGATDLSTVNWVISPLGRNIFISTT